MKFHDSNSGISLQDDPELYVSEQAMDACRRIISNDGAISLPLHIKHFIRLSLGTFSLTTYPAVKMASCSLFSTTSEDKRSHTIDIPEVDTCGV